MKNRKKRNRIRSSKLSVDILPTSKPKIEADARKAGMPIGKYVRTLLKIEEFEQKQILKIKTT